MKYDGKFASRWRAKSPDALCAVLPKDNTHRMVSIFSENTCGVFVVYRGNARCCISQQKKPLTNAAFWRIIKVKRGHTSRRSAPMLSYQEITVQVSSSGRLFPFMVMMIGKQNCCLNQSNLFQKESASQRANAACYFQASQNFKRKREDNRQPVCPLFYIVHISCPLSVRGFFVRYCL